jgi:hypothetical protein
MILYHCTTEKKLQKYKHTGCILMPVRGWAYLESAKNWNKKTGRTIILKIICNLAYPLSDHRPLYHSYWTPENIKKWEVI